MRKIVLLALAGLLAGLGLALSVPAARATSLRAVTETPTNVPTATPLPSATPPPTATPAPAKNPPPAAALLDPLITKRADLARAVVGDHVQFTITVTNPNAADVNGVAVRDPLPAQLDYLSATTTAGTLAYDAATRSLLVTIGRLAPQQVVTIVIETRVNSTGRPPDTITNVAGLTYTNAGGQAVNVQANAATVLLVPSNLPSTGFGPGWREWSGLLAAGGLLALLALAVGGAVRWAFSRRS